MLAKRCPACSRTFATTQRFCPDDGAELVESVAGDPRLGQLVLGRYRLEARIGQGGMGVVYRAEQEGVGREVAVKLVRGDRVGDVASLRRALRELQAMAQLRSPHAVALIDAGASEDGEPCLVMELLRGETLRERIARGPIPWRDALEILRGVTRAVAEAHALGLVHRDLKPANVFLVATAGYAAFPKVLDFGIAASRADAGDSITGTGEVPGTPIYLAPERIVGEATGPAADVYALGVLAWEMLAGRPPFVAEQPHELMVQHLEHDPPRFDRVMPGHDVPRRSRRSCGAASRSRPGSDRPTRACCSRRSTCSSPAR